MIATLILAAVLAQSESRPAEPRNLRYALSNLAPRIKTLRKDRPSPQATKSERDGWNDRIANLASESVFGRVSTRGLSIIQNSIFLAPCKEEDCQLATAVLAAPACAPWLTVRLGLKIPNGGDGAILPDEIEFDVTKIEYDEFATEKLFLFGRLVPPPRRNAIAEPPEAEELRKFFVARSVPLRSLLLSCLRAVREQQKAPARDMTQVQMIRHASDLTDATQRELGTIFNPGKRFAVASAEIEVVDVQFWNCPCIITQRLGHKILLAAPIGTDLAPKLYLQVSDEMARTLQKGQRLRLTFRIVEAQTIDGDEPSWPIAKLCGYVIDADAIFGERDREMLSLLK